MTSIDLIRRIHIVRALTVFIVGMVIAYLLPEVLGLIVKIQAGDAEIRPWDAAMRSMPIRIVHIIGLVIAGLAAIYVFRLWSLRFTSIREGEEA
ncbi:MAG: hypothetical protein AAGA30_12850 [Planctomycetota bacterium]